MVHSRYHWIFKLAPSVIAATIAANSSVVFGDSVTGQELAHSYDYGNCLACHAAPTDADAVTRSNIAPAFVDMQRRFPDREKLSSQIWDARTFNPETIMPPFGANGILTIEEINRIIDYLYTL